ncbi:MAG: hypothetical protein JNL28_15730 [Planctomycetes bacterium]|nr:hypothetical protein [Planctomycetota bacterium]
MTSGVDEPSEGPLTAERWQDLLTLELLCPVRVVYTRARRTPIQVKRVSAPRRGSPSALEVRLHSMFSSAPPGVHRAVASWIRSGSRAPRACAALDEWIATTLESIPVTARVAHGAGRGEHHDLDSLARGLIEREFAGAFDQADAKLPAITWGRRGPSRTRSSLRLGSFDPDPRLVRIHPVLDQAGVPAWFVRFVLFHELLHAVHPPERGSDNRWVHHGRKFRRAERAYVDFERAVEWEKRHLKALIRAARRGTPFVPAAEPVAPPIATVTPPKSRGLLQRLLFPGG